MQMTTWVEEWYHIGHRPLKVCTSASVTRSLDALGIDLDYLPALQRAKLKQSQFFRHHVKASPSTWPGKGKEALSFDWHVRELAIRI